MSTINDAKKYAKKFSLKIFSDREKIADILDLFPEDLDSDMSHAILAVNPCPVVGAFIKNDKLFRFGLASRKEDCGALIPTTLKELIELGDPRNFEDL